MGLQEHQFFNVVFVKSLVWKSVGGVLRMSPYVELELLLEYTVLFSQVLLESFLKQSW